MAEMSCYSGSGCWWKSAPQEDDEEWLPAREEQLVPWRGVVQRRQEMLEGCAARGRGVVARAEGGSSKGGAVGGDGGGDDGWLGLLGHSLSVLWPSSRVSWSTRRHPDPPTAPVHLCVPVLSRPLRHHLLLRLSHDHHPSQRRRSPAGKAIPCEPMNDGGGGAT